MLNRPRQLFQKILQSRKLDDGEKSRTIQRGRELEIMTKQPGWKHLEEFMKRSREGGIEYLDRDTQVVGIWSLVKAINLFMQWLMVNHEIRAYNKIRSYIVLSIQKGKQYATEQQLAEERRKRSEPGKKS